jgi:hypothetical protein
MSNHYLFQGYKTDTEQILSTISQLLEPFRVTRPEVVEDILTAVRNGQSLEQAGKIMVEAVRVILAQFKQEGDEKQAALQKTIDELTDSNQDQALEIVELRSDLEVIQKELKFIVDETQGYKQTIATQNKLLARQQKKLQKLLGNTQEDE